MILQIKDLHVHYGAIKAIKGISLEVNEGEIVTLIGPNGAGKTTLLRTISGLLRPVSGCILYQDNKGQDVDLEKRPSHWIVSHGVAQVPEGRLIFHNLSVQENLEMGAFSRCDGTKIKVEYDFVFHLFPKLKERLFQNAGTLSGGEQQMLAVGRALMAKPRLLLLDEPSLGLAPTLVQQIFKALVEINKQGMTILLVEQDAFLALKCSQRAYVLETGEIKLQGLSCELLKNPDVQKAYLGRS